ncbi:translocation and assembly module lipoprotein TamL [Sphingobacterium paucimobilis]|uniref:Bacterial surface antigen (D15) domain-containing protein n=1 Tax=Sphingobacterium paucimobilis HER1398 TaxID=1346330 RepID=U2J9V8_9SPHI|nr:BamA/TamA family outer membrane protein [Sphingobacterium paucimobilis]ERJ59453.1 hypothetical protein M472_11775 [Sphingobacterium paucimobilis HER1398]
MTIKRRLLFFASITLLLLKFASCRSAKYLDDNQALVTEVDMTGVPKELKESAYAYVSNEIRPNSVLNLTIYNLFNTQKGKYKTQKIRQVGEAPHLLDSSLVELSGDQIQRFLNTKGYFTANVRPQLLLNKKKAKIDFVAELRDPFFVQKIKYDFDEPAFLEIYNEKVAPLSGLKEGMQYDASRLAEEREKLYLSIKNKGYFDFLRQYMRVGVDTTMLGNHADLFIKVANPDSGFHRRYHIGQVSLHILTGNGKKLAVAQERDPSTGLILADQTSRFRLKPIARYMYIRPGQVYSLENETLSYDRLYEMNGFRSVKIHYEKADSNLLDVSYELIPRPLMANQVEGEYTFSSGMSGFNIGNTFSHRNVFGGAELLEVKLRYGVLFDPRLSGNLAQKIFNNDFQVGVNLVVPRLLLPFGVRSSGRFGLPRTTFSSSLQLFNQDGTYSNRYFINTLNYSWWKSRNLQHSFTPLVLEYRAGRFNPDFKARLIEEGYQLYVESNDRQYFGLGAQYAITWNAPKLQKLEDFSFVRGIVDLSGNTLGVLNSLFHFSQNAAGMNTLFGVAYLQYAKAEADYRLYRYLGGNRQLVFRFNAGVIVPYGNNSELLIFEKSLFAGGMNGMRAWQARTLGPGGYNRSSIRASDEAKTEQLRLNLRNLDQLGELKLESNVEYRFRLLDNFLGAKMNGATFVDMGNIWRLRPNALNQDGEFKFDRFFSQIALGTGFGLRFDMDYFTMRLDAGLKLKDPQFTGADQWVVKHLFDAKDFKDKYRQTNSPDRYGFFQYNFGVGLPF